MPALPGVGRGGVMGQADASGRANQMGLSPGRVRFIGSRCHSLPSLPFPSFASLSLSLAPLSSPLSLPPASTTASAARTSSGPPPPRPRRSGPARPARPPARRASLHAGPPLRFASPHRRPALDGRPPPPPRSRSLPVALLLRGPTPCDSRDPLTAASAGDCCSWIGGQRRSALGTAARM